MHDMITVKLDTIFNTITGKKKRTYDVQNNMFTFNFYQTGFCSYIKICSKEITFLNKIKNKDCQEGTYFLLEDNIDLKINILIFWKHIYIYF